MNTFLVDERYEDKLKKVNAELIKKRRASALPALTPAQEKVLADNLSFGCCRVAKFLFSQQGERTDTIKKSCAVTNVSDAVIGFEKSQTAALARIGLSITCEKIPARNLYGNKCVIGTWFLSIDDPQKWIELTNKCEEIK